MEKEGIKNIKNILKGKDLPPDELRKYREGLNIKLDVFDIIKLEYFIATAQRKLADYEKDIPGAWTEYIESAEKLLEVLGRARENNLEFISKVRD